MTEESRKALVELLLLATYLDKHLSLDEDEMLDTALKGIGWDPANPGNISLPETFALVRKVGSDEVEIYEFMRARAFVVKSSGDSELAYNWLMRLLVSDGIAAEETQFLGQIKPMLFG